MFISPPNNRPILLLLVFSRPYYRRSVEASTPTTTTIALYRVRTNGCVRRLTLTMILAVRFVPSFKMRSTTHSPTHAPKHSGFSARRCARVVPATDWSSRTVAGAIASKWKIPNESSPRLKPSTHKTNVRVFLPMVVLPRRILSLSRPPTWRPDRSSKCWASFK
jgi:hypothetical protein